jgi:hypothetical protein
LRVAPIHDAAPSAPRLIAFDDIPALVGERFEGEAFRLQDADLRGFERATWLDRAYPAGEPSALPAGIVEGFYALSLFDALLNRVVRFDPATTYGFNYGLDRVRFVTPLFAGDDLRFHARFEAVVPKGEGYLVRLGCGLDRVGAPRPGVVASWLVYQLPRTP